jgi:hypothetical protein
MEATQEMTQAEEQKIRAEVAAELDAEEKGEALPQSSADAPIEKETKEKVEDPWAGVNPALKQAFKDLSQKVATDQNVAARLKQAESRIGSLTNELHNAKEAVKKVQDAPTKEQMEAATKSDEAWENLKNDFPEWAEAFDGRFDRKLKDLKDSIKTVSPEDLEKLRTTLAEGTQEEIQKAILGYAHSGWQTKVASPAYKEWIKTQPEEVVALTKSPLASDAISVLDRFEAETGKEKTASEIAADRRQRMKTSIIPQGKRSTPVKSETDMTDAELRQKIGREVYAE